MSPSIKTLAILVVAYMVGAKFPILAKKVGLV